VADNVAITPGAGATVAADDIGAGVLVQRVKATWGPDGTANDTDVATGKPMPVQLREPDGTDVALAAKVGALTESAPGTDTASSGLNGRLQRIAQRLSALIALLPTALGANGGLRVEGVAGGTAVPVSGSVTAANAAGDVAHDGGDSGNPIKVGGVAVAHGANPTAVAAGDRTNLYANRAGVPFAIGGHPNVVTVKHANITTAVTDAAIVTVGAGLKIVVTAITATLDNASTVFPSLLVGFGAANTPTTTGVILAHGGVPAGGGVNRGDGSGILGIGGDGEDLRVTTTGNATGNGLQIVVSYYTIES
jgi:hypothetical protein